MTRATVKVRRRPRTLRIDTDCGPRMVKCVARYKGLAVTLGVGSRARKWRVTHERTGLAIPGTFDKQDDALEYMHIVGPFTDWPSATTAGLRDDQTTIDAVRAVCYALGGIDEYYE